ncbi:unnamed protein product [Protopolystoma xenopodis]|uniref:Uncharacterized protein n=1 Tax=Protopolystoma xenopodis TaxID=117903 RepID=A0A3S5BZE1_9PLAT|nr:unnamed protein product [Protopolystoma xenopodis]
MWNIQTNLNFLLVFSYATISSAGQIQINQSSNKHQTTLNRRASTEFAYNDQGKYESVSSSDCTKDCLNVGAFIDKMETVTAIASRDTLKIDRDHYLGPNFRKADDTHINTSFGDKAEFISDEHKQGDVKAASVNGYRKGSNQTETNMNTGPDTPASTDSDTKERDKEITDAEEMNAINTVGPSALSEAVKSVNVQRNAKASGMSGTWPDLSGTLNRRPTRSDVGQPIAQ